MERDHWIGVYAVLLSALDSRRSFSQWLYWSYDEIAAGGSLQLRDGKSPHGILGWLHLALATELYKSTDGIAGLFIHGEASDEENVVALINVNGQQAGKFYSDTLCGLHSSRQLRDMIPLPAPHDVDLKQSDREFLTTVIDRTCEALTDQLRRLGEKRAFLAPIRNKFSHSNTFGAFTAGSAGGDPPFLPVLKPPSEDRGVVKLFEDVLLPSSHNHKRLFEMVWRSLRIEQFVLTQRLERVQHNRSLLPVGLPVGVLRSEEEETHYKSILRQTRGPPEWKVSLNLRADAARIRAAQEFYSNFV